MPTSSNGRTPKNNHFALVQECFKRKNKMKIKYLLLALGLTSCAGFSRSCSSTIATEFGGDWIVVKTDMNGKAFRCWRLEGVSVTNEPQSDGIYWKTNEGHLVHVSGSYDRIQVTGNDWSSAYKELGITVGECLALRK